MTTSATSRTHQSTMYPKTTEMSPTSSRTLWDRQLWTSERPTSTMNWPRQHRRLPSTARYQALGHHIDPRSHQIYRGQILHRRPCRLSQSLPRMAANSQVLAVFRSSLSHHPLPSPRSHQLLDRILSRAIWTFSSLQATTMTTTQARTTSM